MQIQSPIKAVSYDVFFELKDDKGYLTKVIAGQSVNREEAERLAFHPNRPKGSRLVCKLNR